ncbi:hypothetical protein HELRODRAFT_84726 [Helobdella robusta]|uniref:HAT C-terminal dimerisation domain-containing protein n=1 Tax=Helobdella robusta TaxID=6412 RepID=T1G5M7_HELRO|nr:hypothetical protein HELRODRAFT_84726 [Helobdella robusta]ESN98243.1 hypothetical protein HELRODRAFT_84726 [Helobdella robusta]
MNSQPKTAIEALALCNSNLYLTIHSLLSILCTMPVSVATAERSFSTLRRLKTWMRSKMKEERLTGLALMNIHCDTELDIEDIITRFGRKKCRKMTFVL